jgi:hypothetical protein
MSEDIYVCEGWYGLVALAGGYLLVYFLLDSDITSGNSEGYTGGGSSVPDGIFLTDKNKNCLKLYKVPGPDGYYFCSIPDSRGNKFWRIVTSDGVEP